MTGNERPMIRKINIFQSPWFFSLIPMPFRTCYLKKPTTQKLIIWIDIFFSFLSLRTCVSLRQRRDGGSKRWVLSPQPQSDNSKWVTWMKHQLAFDWMTYSKLGPLTRKALGGWQKPSSAVWWEGLFTWRERIMASLYGLIERKWESEHEAAIKRPLQT